ncbi:unnamed protein product [Phytomonas sp. EM1]|nr:unnamed protein product [Phytomonas sp. EM1]|eukprot:CCW61639.1 unnamed protein product [Phytomonas sp. isolate EM1]
MHFLRSPTWSVYDGEGQPFDFNGSEEGAPYVPYVSEAPPFLTLRSSGLKKEALMRHGVQSAVYTAYEAMEAVREGEGEGANARRRFAVKRLFTLPNDFGIRGVPETALREVTLLWMLQQKQEALLGRRQDLVGGNQDEETPLDPTTTTSFSSAGGAYLDNTARILTFYRAVEAPHRELCLIMELCAMDLSRVVISHTKKFTACQDLDIARSFTSALPSASNSAEMGAFVRACPGTIRHIDRKRCPILSQMCVVRYLLRRLLRMVCFLHEECGILHRDLKLSNILITQEGGLRLSDFGSARLRMPGFLPHAAASTLERKDAPVQGDVAYTPATMRTTKIYQPPECLLGDCLYSTTIDMWSVGVIFGELVRQSHLFHGESELAVIGEIWALLGVPSSGEAGSDSRRPADPPPELGVRWSPPTGPSNGIHPSSTTTEGKGLRCKFPLSVLSEEGFDLLQRMLCLDHSRRITTREALHHVFLKFEGDQADDDVGAKLWKQKVAEILDEGQKSVAIQMPLLAEDHDDDAYVIPNFAINLR